MLNLLYTSTHYLLFSLRLLRYNYIITITSRYRHFTHKTYITLLESPRYTGLHKRRLNIKMLLQRASNTRV